MAAFLFGYIYLNAKMYLIAKTRPRNATVHAVTATSRAAENGIKRRMEHFKNISTCSLAFVCFCISSFPAMLVAGLRSARKIPEDDWLVSLWSMSFVSMNSTINCLVFFWKNPILCSEGVKLVNRLRRSLNH